MAVSRFASRFAASALLATVAGVAKASVRQIVPEFGETGATGEAECTTFKSVRFEKNETTKEWKSFSVETLTDMDENDIAPIRAVKYWPEPIGYKDAFVNQTDKDPYTLSYANIHARDLPMMKYELGANALLLGPWSLEGRSHSDFLHKARVNKLMVIPSFDISWYWEEGNWNNADTHAALRSDFKVFLEGTAERSSGRKPYTPEVVLMWNIVGLPRVELLFPRSCLNLDDVNQLKDCFNTNSGEFDAVATMREFQEIMQIIRTEQSAFFCTEGPFVPDACQKPDDDPTAFVFDRPLALTVELGADFALAATKRNLDYLKGFTLWMERVLGCVSVLENQIEVPLFFNQTLGKCRFHGRGFFDAWVFKVVTATSDTEAGRMAALLNAFDRPREPTRRDDDDLEDVAGVLKPVVFEFGFSAITPLGKLDAKKQHNLLRNVWTEVNSSQEQGLCVHGAAVDEWVDVWSADQEYPACMNQISSQYMHSTCGPSTDAGTVAVGFMGIMGQFDTFMTHCINHRVTISDDESEDEMFRFLSHTDIRDAQEQTNTFTGPLGFEVTGKYIEWKPGLCRRVWLRPGLSSVLFGGVMLLTVALVLISCCRGGCCCCCCRGAKKPEQMHDYGSDHNLTLAMQSAASKRVLEDISAAPYGKLLAGMVAEALEDEKLEVPLRYEHLVGYSGWGIKKVGGKFSYHRLQYDGLGRGETVMLWDKEDFVKWLQDQSDRTMAIFGFSEEDLRRPDLIGNKTITIKQLLEMLEFAKQFPPIENADGKADGKGEAELECLGTTLKFTLRLRYRACPVFLSGVVDNGPKLKDYDNISENASENVSSWLQDIAAHTKRYLTVLANSHLQVQGERLRRQLEHEAEALLADAKRRAASREAGDGIVAGGVSSSWWIAAAQDIDAQKRACYNIWRRACEGVHLWQQLHGLEKSTECKEDEFQRYFAEALLLRLLESVGEHLIHAPEWLARVYQKSLQELKSTPDEPGVFSFDVDYANLCEPLQDFCRNSNVFAKKQGINFDDMNDHGLSTSEAPEPSGLVKTYSEPIGPRVLFNIVVNYQWPLTMVVWLLSVVLVLHDSQTFSTFRSTTFGDEQFSPFLILLVDFAWLAFVNLCALWVHTPITPHTVKNPHCRFPRVVSLVAFVVLVPLTALMLWVESGLWSELSSDEEGVGLIEQSLPESLGGRAGMRVNEVYWLVPFCYLTARFAFGLLPTRNLRLRFKNVEKKGHHKRICLFWVVFGLICFMTYYAVLIDMARSLTPSNLCQLGDELEDFCGDRTVSLGFNFDLQFPIKDTQCVACMTSVVSAWTLAALGSLLVPYFIFNCCVSFMGSSLGVARGLVETSTSSLDFSVHPWSSEFDRLRKSEANLASQGTILHAIYGKEWKKVWDVMVDGLSDDCLINSALREKLLGAARTGAKVELIDSGSLRILPLAKQRIGYLFASHREILSNNRIKFSPYRGNDRDVHCDALGVTHPGRIPSLTQIIPVYSEDGIMSINELLAKGQQSVATTLEFLISQFPDEWRIFTEMVKSHPTQLYDNLVSGQCSQQQQEQVCEWASHRAQSVIRTVNGAVHYHKALQLLLNRGQGVGFDDLRRRVQLILAHQTYGKVSLSKPVQAHLKGGELKFKWRHGLAQGDKVRLSSQARESFDVAGAFTLMKAKGKFKANLTPRVPKADSNPSLPGRTAVAGAKQRPTVVFSLTVLNLKHDSLMADKPALKELEAAIKGALKAEVGDIKPDDVALTVINAEEVSDEGSESAPSDQPPRSSSGARLRGVHAASEGPAPEVSVECVIAPPATMTPASLEAHLSSSATLKLKLAEAIGSAKGVQAVAVSELSLGEVSAISQVMPAIPGGSFKEFVSGAFYTVERVLDDNSVVLVGTTADCGQVLSEKVEASKRDKDLHYMLQKHKGYPFFVAIDFHRGKTHPRLEELIDQHIQSVAGGEGVRFKYASALIKYRYCRVGAKDVSEDDWPIEIVHVLPRARGLLIGSEGNLSQGKSGNQLGALRFAEGHFLQMMDANMGCYSGESFKVPVVLQGFYNKPPQGEDGEHRLDLRARIIGFREHIFTRSHGLVGTIMADAEWTFGTLVQRLLGFLNVRMHYGHPDFMDCFWACNRGSVSKASPHVNLSEDIFAGLNVNARNERSLHTDILEWEKGREVQFCAGSGFFWKIASGSVGLMRTRDLRGLCGRASIMQSIALYFATVAWYLHNILVDYGTELYVLLFIFLTFASKSLSDLGVLGSALAVEWFLTPALSATLPALIGFGVEYGPWWLVTHYLPTVPASMIYFIFINKSMASSVRSTIWANTAEYVNTGRPHANKSYSMKDAFVQFRVSHYVPAVTLLYLVTAYSRANVGGALPMVMIVATAVCWVVAPVLFRPPTARASVFAQFMELVTYVFNAPLSSSGHMLPGKATCLYEAALEQELKRAHRDPGQQLLAALALSLLYAFMAVTTVFEQMPAAILAWALTFCIKAIWRISGMKQSGLVNLTFLLMLPIVLSFAWVLVDHFNFSTLLLSMIIFLHIMHTAKVFCWNLARLILPKSAPLGYDRVVHLLFDFGLGYQLQVYSGIAVLVLQAICEAFLWVLDHPLLRLRLRTRVLLNKHVSYGCVTKMYGEAPSQAVS